MNGITLFLAASALTLSTVMSEDLISRCLKLFTDQQTETCSRFNGCNQDLGGLSESDQNTYEQMINCIEKDQLDNVPASECVGRLRACLGSNIIDPSKILVASCLIVIWLMN